MRRRRLPSAVARVVWGHRFDAFVGIAFTGVLLTFVPLTHLYHQSRVSLSKVSSPHREMRCSSDRRPAHIDDGSVRCFLIAKITSARLHCVSTGHDTAAASFLLVRHSGSVWLIVIFLHL